MRVETLSTLQPPSNSSQSSNLSQNPIPATNQNTDNTLSPFTPPKARRNAPHRAPARIPSCSSTSSPALMSSPAQKRSALLGKARRCKRVFNNSLFFYPFLKALICRKYCMFLSLSDSPSHTLCVRCGLNNGCNLSAA